MEIKYPNVKVALVGEDGNAFAIIGRVVKAMRREKVPEDEIKAYQAEAASGDYDHLLRVTMSWVDTDPEDE